MGANGLQPILNAIMSIFSFIGCRCLRLSPLTCCVSCSSPRLFAHVLCNSPYRFKQAQNMSGSVLLTTEASQLSVGIAEVAYYIENPKTTSKRIIFMELFDILEMLRKLAILCK